MAFDSYNMVFTDEAEWETFKDDNLIVKEPEPGEPIVGEYKSWVQGVHIMPIVDNYYFTGIHEDPPAYHSGYFVCIITNGRKAVCQAEVVEAYVLEQFHYFQGGQFFQTQWQKYSP